GKSESPSVALAVEHVLAEGRVRGRRRVLAGLASENRGRKRVAAELAAPAEAFGFVADEFSRSRSIERALDLVEELGLATEYVRAPPFLGGCRCEQRDAAGEAPDLCDQLDDRGNVRAWLLVDDPHAAGAARGVAFTDVDAHVSSLVARRDRVAPRHRGATLPRTRAAASDGRAARSRRAGRLRRDARGAARRPAQHAGKSDTPTRFGGRRRGPTRRCAPSGARRRSAR